MKEIDQIESLLKQRLRLMNEVIAKCEADMKKHVEGRLKIITRGNKVRYKICFKGGKSRYISEPNLDLIRSLAQNTYAKRMLKMAIAEKDWIVRTLKRVPKESVEDLYCTNINRRELITPYFETDEEYIARWMAKTYMEKGFREVDPDFRTEKNERVRSKSEVLIANKLNKLGIPYIYEYPIILSSGRVVYPDFKILDVKNRKDIIHEHFGMMDDPEYVIKCMAKLAEYEKSGLFVGDRLIVSFESRTQPFSDKLFETQLRAHGLVRE